jgi:preprotein translocase subunit YajC
VKGWESFLPLLLIALVFWLLLIRPQRNRQPDLARLKHTLTPGAEVMLSSGIYGTVESVDDDRVRLQLAPGTTVTVARQAVLRIDKPGTDEPTPDVAPETGMPADPDSGPFGSD